MAREGMAVTLDLLNKLNRATALGLLHLLRHLSNEAVLDYHSCGWSLNWELLIQPDGFVVGSGHRLTRLRFMS